MFEALRRSSEVCSRILICDYYITGREQSDLATTAKLWHYNFSLIYLLIIALTTPLDLKRTFHFQRRY